MLPRTVLALTCLGALLGGCGSNPAKQVRNDAAREWHCDTDDVDVRRRNHDTYVVVGCERQGVYQCRDDLGEINCVNLAWMARDRAGAEFNCDPFELTLDELSPYIFRVTGCGQEAAYHCQISGTVARCVVDTAPHPQGGAAPPEAAPEPAPEPPPDEAASTDG